MTDKKYREFYVNPERMFLQWHNGREYKFSHCHTSPFWKNEIHVIEHRALVDAEAKIKKLERLIELAEKLLVSFPCNCPHRQVLGHFSDCTHPKIWGSKFFNKLQEYRKELESK